MFSDFKRRREDEERLEREGRVPPGQSLTQKFPVLHYGPVPRFNPAAWELRIWGEVEKEIRWSWDEFNQLPRTKTEMDLHCVTRWSKFDTTWEGVSVRTLVDQGLVKPKPDREICDAGGGVRLHGQFAYRCCAAGELPARNSFQRRADLTRSWLPVARRSWRNPQPEGIDNAVFVERRKVAAGAGIHVPGPAGILGASRIS